MTIRRLAPLLLLLLLLGSALPAAADTVRAVDIRVTHNGFNGDPNLDVAAEEGEMVELHFTYGDTDLAEDNPHIISIVGTDLETTQLDREHPTAVLRFRADKVGTYTIACKLTCSGHDNLGHGRLRVVPFGSAGSAGKPQATQINVTTKPPATPEGQAEVHARVTTAAGAPLEGVTVDFSVRTTFIIADWLPVGEARTDSSGDAVLRFRPNRSGDQTVRAHYEGSGRFQPAERAVNLAAGEVRPAFEPERTLRVPGLGFWLLWLLVGGVWCTYGLIFFQLRQLSLDR